MAQEINIFNDFLNQNNERKWEQNYNGDFDIFKSCILQNEFFLFSMEEYNHTLLAAY